MDEPKPKKTIGRAEKLQFPELNFVDVYARIDTGAATSAIWASRVEAQDGVLQVTFFGKESPHFTGQTVQFSDFDTTVVASSTGEAQQRYVVTLLVGLRGRRVRAKFTLADRSTQVYPVLIGRNVLRGKFIVDVKHGKTLRTQEKKRTESLRQQLDGTKE